LPFLTTITGFSDATVHALSLDPVNRLLAGSMPSNWLVAGPFAVEEGPIRWGLDTKSNT
jgi:hypothetical protein